eukprot:6459755-Amphidinium_carterae.2
MATLKLMLANPGTAAYGPLDPDAAWTSWADFAKKVYHVWRLVGPQLRERPYSEPRVKLQANAFAEEPADTGIIGMFFPETPFQLGPHLLNYVWYATLPKECPHDQRMQ